MSSAKTFPRLDAEWDNGAAFLGQVRARAGTPTFLRLHEASSQLPPDAVPGAICSVTIRFRDRGVDFHVHARVVEREPEDPAQSLRLAFLPEEKERQELVLAYAEGESVPYLRRKAVRTPCALEAEVTLAGGKQIAGSLVNISERGTSLAVNEALVADQRLELAIAFPGQRKRVRVSGRVTASIAGVQRGAGIEFLFESSKQRDEIAAAVTKLRASGPS